MQENKKLCLLIFILFICSSLHSFAQNTGADSIPEFTLFKHDKSTFTKNDLDTQKLLFFLFFDVKCEHCLHAIQTINQKYGEMDNTFIYLVTQDSPEAVERFLARKGKNLINRNNVIVLFDLQHQFIVRFKPRKYPSIFLYSPAGNLLLYDDNPNNLPRFFERINKAKYL